jgi:hypothetical protein
MAITRWWRGVGQFTTLEAILFYVVLFLLYEVIAPAIHVVQWRKSLKTRLSFGELLRINFSPPLWVAVIKIASALGLAFCLLYALRQSSEVMAVVSAAWFSLAFAFNTAFLSLTARGK